MLERYKFNSKDSKTIVNAIVNGYRDYVEHRIERDKKMIISSAFAWTKSNFIETRIANEVNRRNISYKTATAGLTWKYLQFYYTDSKRLFIVKNATYFNENSFSNHISPNRSKGRTRSYLHELSKINHHITFPNTKQIQAEFTNSGSEQLVLYIPGTSIDDELESIKSTFEEFHVITYKIDASYQISEIIHYLPNPDDNIAYKIENLTKYISGAELSDMEREIIAPVAGHDILDLPAFDIFISDDDEEKEG